MDYQKDTTNTYRTKDYCFVVDSYFASSQNETLAQKLAAVILDKVRNSIVKQGDARYNKGGKH